MKKLLFLVLSLLVLDCGCSSNIQQNQEDTVDSNVTTIEKVAGETISRTGRIKQRDLKLVRSYCDRPFNQNHKEGICSAFYHQYYNDILVWNSLVGVTTINGRVVLTKEQYFNDINISTRPSIRQATVADIALRNLGARDNVRSISLVIYPNNKRSKYSLAWMIQLSRYIYFVDAINGSIIDKLDKLRTVGNVTGEIFPEYVNQKQISVPFPNNNFEVNGVTLVTDTEGFLKAELGDSIIGNLNGPYVEVINLLGNKAHYEGSDPNINWKNFDNSHLQEESHAFYFVNKAHDFFTKGEPFDIFDLDFPMKAYLNGTLNGQKECNAFANYTEVDGKKVAYITFLGAGEVCESEALSSDTIFHEYTHTVNTYVFVNGLEPYWDQTGGMNEGLADYFAATINDNSCMSEVYNNGKIECIRNLDNEKHYPEDYYEEPHMSSEVFSASLWDVRKLLGKTITDDIVIRTMKLQPGSYSEFIKYMLTIDDDDADLTNGTPDINTICHAFYDNHGLFVPECAGHTEEIVAFLTAPKIKDFIYGTETVDIIGTAHPSIKGEKISYTVEYSDSNNGVWKTIDSGNEPKNDQLFVSIPSSELKTGDYSLRLKVNSALSFKDFPVHFYYDKEIHKGWPNLDEFFQTPPVTADINNDGLKEVIIVDLDFGKMHAYNIYGEDLEGWPPEIGVTSSPSQVSITDFDLDQQLEIVGGNQPLRIIKGDGAAYNDWLYQVYNTHLCLAPSIADINNDGDKEIIFRSLSTDWDGEKFGRLNIVNKNGEDLETWPKYFEDKIVNSFNFFSQMAVGDLDGDGDIEIVIAVPTEDANVYAFHHDGTLVTGWPRSMECILTSDDFQQTLLPRTLSSPALADVDGNGKLEVFIGSHCPNGYVFGWRHDGTELAGWPKITEQKVKFSSSVGIGDVNGDSKLEVVIGTSTYLYVWPGIGDATIEGYPVEHKIIPYAEEISTPSIGDVNGDGLGDIVISIFDELYAFDQKGNVIDTFPKKGVDVLWGSIIDDIDNDGLVEIVTSGNKGVYVWDTNSPYNKDNLDWIKLGSDLENTGNFSNYHSCIDSDGDKMMDQIFERGRVLGRELKTGLQRDFVDECSGKYVVNEYFCVDSGVNKGISERHMYCPAGNLCANGACTSCVDSDGKDTTVQGTSQGFDENNKLQTYSDTCFNDSYVIEVSCKDGKLAAEFIQCEGGKFCINGACTICFDSDGGFIKNVKGYVKGFHPVTGELKEEYDVCLSSTHGIEKYCKEETGKYSWNGFECLEGTTCEDGACVEK